MRVFALILCVAAMSCAPPATRVSVQFVAPCDQQELLSGLSELQIGERAFHVRDFHVGTLSERKLESEKELLVQGVSSKGQLIARVGSPTFALRTDSGEPARVLLAAPNRFVSAASQNGKCITIQDVDEKTTLLGYAVSYVPNINKVLIVGGLLRTPGQEDKYTNTVQSYDPDTGAFTTLPPLKIARAFHTASASSTGKVLIAGGRGELLGQVKELRPGVIMDLTSTEAKYDETVMLLPRVFHKATPLNASGTKVALTGGCSKGCDFSTQPLQLDASSFQEVSRAIEIIDLDSKARVVKEDALSEGRALHGASVIRDRFVVLTGGVGQKGILSSVEVYDVQKETMVKDLLVNKLDTPLAQHGQVTDKDNDAVILIGGNRTLENNEIMEPSDSLVRWDPIKGAHPFGLQLLNAQAVENQIVMSDKSVVLLGGTRQKESFAERIIFDAKYPRSETLAADFETSAHALSAVAISGNRVVVVLGKQSPWTSQIKMLTLE